jgi:hypothetical protein
MKILFPIVMAGMLTACGSMGPVKTSFPDLPPELMKPPVEMATILPIDESQKIAPTDEAASAKKLSEVTKVITSNYKAANLNREQVLKLQDWLREQKKLNP